MTETVAEEAPAAPPEVGEESVPFEELSDDALRLRLDMFEGPFEVLLYLIRTQEIDIFDIPILKVTEQYLRFLDLMREEHLDVAGEFIVMAATLIQIKSKMILPIEVDDEEEEEIEEEDPRLELVEKLLEYRKFRDLADTLGDLEEQRAGWFGRNVKPVIEETDEDDYIEVSLYDLLQAVRDMLRFITGDIYHRVTGEVASIEEKITRISDLLEERESVSWSELYAECKGRLEVVCCLLAILELCRMERLRAHQHSSFGEIRLFARDPGTAPAPAPEQPDAVAS